MYDRVYPAGARGHRVRGHRVRGTHGSRRGLGRFDASDWDEDGVANDADLDRDNDGVPNDAEGEGDEDGDGDPNALDRDADGDGLSDIGEAGGGGLDQDGDWTIDALSDLVPMDGLHDPLQAADDALPLPDSDADGVPDFRDSDDDDDGRATLDERTDAMTYGDDSRQRRAAQLPRYRYGRGHDWRPRGERRRW